MRYFLIAIGLFFLGGCNLFRSAVSAPDGNFTNYRYIPLAGLPVDQTFKADSCKIDHDRMLKEGQKIVHKPILQSLPNITTRFSLANKQANGTVTFGAQQITAEGQRYRAVVDYVNVDTVPFNVGIEVSIDKRRLSLREARYVMAEAKKRKEPLPRIEYSVTYVGQYDDNEKPDLTSDDPFVVTFPVYVGIGMRLTAEIEAIKGKVELSGLSAIAGQAEAGNLTGTLTAEMIGISGSSISGALPIPSKLDQTTIEASILALGASRASFLVPDRNKDEVNLIPQVVGLYSPVSTDPDLINAVYSLMARNRVRWYRPCEVKDMEDQETETTTAPQAS